MTGEEIKKKLAAGGYTISTLAAMMGTSQQNLSIKLSKEAIKTDLLEKICNLLHKDLTFFYGGTEYLPTFSNNTDEQNVPYFLYKEIREERDTYRDTIKDLQNQISLMQQGMTMPEIAKREAV